MKWILLPPLIFVLIPIVLFTGCSASGNNQNIILVTTTSVQDTGLLDVLVDIFKKGTGYNIKTIAVGSGEAIAMGKRGDADVLLVHSPNDEEMFMKEGFGKSRYLLMTNYFVLVGPPDDPAGCSGVKSVAEAFDKIADSQSVFVSRADNSGTHKMELSIWSKINIKPDGKWYLQAQTGMGAVLQMADEKKGYTLADKGTYLAFRNKVELKEMSGKDEMLLNTYSVITLNPERFPKANLKGAEDFAAFLTSTNIQKIISEFGKDKYREPLFYPIE